MSHQVLARKWRPRDFTQLVGQEHVVRALGNALDHDRLHHAFLFTGTRGVGKTTLSRILAKSLNCERGVSSKPCGVCAACRAIDEGRFVDLIEVDAASRTKVEDTRELLENVQYTPAIGRYKVYLIDEVHMLSTHSFNALLKTLEEPPPHVKFLLATTDPQKLPVTVLSRCLQFSLKRLPAAAIARHLAYILGEECVAFEAPALDLIARAGDGSMRDALSLLDQAIAYGGGHIGSADTAAMLGTIDRGQVLHIALALAEADPAALLAAVEVLDRQAPDYAGVLAEMLALWQRVALIQVLPTAPVDDRFDAEAVAVLAARMSPEDVQLCYQIGLHARRDLPLAPEARGGFEMALLRMLCFRPAAAPAPEGDDRGRNAGVCASADVPPSPPPAGTSGAAPAGRRGAAALSAAFAERRTASEPASQSSPTHPPASVPTTSARATVVPIGGRALARASALLEPVDTVFGAAEPEPAMSAEPVGPEAHVTPVVPADAPPDGVVLLSGDPAALAAASTAPFSEPTPSADAVDWECVLAVLSVRGLVLELARNCAWGGREGDLVTLWLAADKAKARTPQAEERLTAALSQHFGTALRLRLEIGGVGLETPASAAAHRETERRLDAERAFRDDALVRALTETFAARLRLESIVAVDAEPAQGQSAFTSARSNEP